MSKPQSASSATTPSGLKRVVAAAMAGGKSLHLVDSESAARIAALGNAQPAATRRGDSLA